jgi:hypothetical protein
MKISQQAIGQFGIGLFAVIAICIMYFPISKIESEQNRQKEIDNKIIDSLTKACSAKDLEIERYQRMRDQLLDETILDNPCQSKINTILNDTE